MHTAALCASPHPAGQLVAVNLEKKVPTLHARVKSTHGEHTMLTIPVTCADLQVALLPPDDPEASIVNRSWEKTFSSVSEILESSTMPPVRMHACMDHLH